MAEAVGLVLAVVSLAGAFKGCVDSFSYFSVVRSFATDYELLATKLDAEKLVLLQWADRVRLLHEEHCDKRLHVESTRKAVAQILASIKLLLNNGTELKSRYGIEEAAESQIMALPDHISSNRMERFVQEFNAMELRLSNGGGKEVRAQKRKNASILRNVRWAISDKDKFDKLIDQLSYFISKLFLLVPDQSQDGTKMSQQDTELLSPHDLRLLRSAVHPERKALVNAVDNAWQELISKRVLDCMWFPTMDDRKAAITRNEEDTFHWALESQRDLLDWFEAGEGIYWISGKPGSGKSTLMKFLFNDRRTKKLLERWVEKPTELKMFSFFLWNIGTEEQKSQEGLSRAMIFHILQADPSLISHILPRLWAQVERSSSRSANPDPPPPPSKGDLREAFELLQSCKPKHLKYCVFIDGVDELAGDYSEAIELVQSLARLQQFKFLVSSRPIASCEIAFSERPKLKLQDLTRSDIELYVRRHITQHPNWEMLMTDDIVPRNGKDLIQEIIDKAMGVFLWVVLACKSVREGLTNFDSMEELYGRVKELPSELEDLFAHMLSRIDPRYQKEAARLLRIAYSHHVVHQSRALCTFELSIANDMGDFYYSVSNELSSSAKKRNSKMRNLEGRLRSRCLGLLDTNETQDLKHCVAANDPHSPHRIVDFMHRTVFEFLNQPGAWSLQCLNAGTDSFDTFAALAWTNLHLCFLLLTGNYKIDRANEEVYLTNIKIFAQQANPSGFRSLCLLLNQVDSMAGEWREFCPVGGVLERIRRSSVRIASIPGGRCTKISLILAIEAGMTEFVREYVKTKYADYVDLKSRTNLLQHATFPRIWHSDPSPDMVAFLLEIGHDPNENALDFELDSHRTPSEVTTWSLLAERLSDPAMLNELSYWQFDSLLRITQSFVDAGADVGYLDGLNLDRMEHEIPCRIWTGRDLSSAIRNIHRLRDILNKRLTHTNQELTTSKKRKRANSHQSPPSVGSSIHKSRNV